MSMVFCMRASPEESSPFRPPNGVRVIQMGLAAVVANRVTHTSRHRSLIFRGYVKIG